MSELPLTSLNIAQFRGIQDLKLDAFGRVNLLVGLNNAGKTSVLDAISLFCRPLDIANWRETARRREVKSSRTPETEPFKWLFPQFTNSRLPNPHSIWIYGNGGFAGRRVMAEYNEFEEYGQTEFSIADPDDEEISSESNRGLEISVLADYAPYTDPRMRLPGESMNLADAQNSVEFRIVDNRRNTYPTAVKDPAIEMALISTHSHKTTQDTSWYFSRAIEREKTNEHFRQDVLEVLQRFDSGILDIDVVRNRGRTVSLSVKH